MEVSGEILHVSKAPFEVKGTTFLPQNIREIPQVLTKNDVVKAQLIITSSLLPLGLLVMNSSNFDVKIFGGFLAFVGSGGIPAVIFPEIYKRLVNNPIIKDPYPNIFGPLSNDKLKSIINDGVRGFYSGGNRVISVLDSKKKLIDIYISKVDPENGAKDLYNLMLETPDLDLRSFIIGILEKKARPVFQNDVLRMFRDEKLPQLERSVAAKLAIKWNLGSDKTEIDKLKTEAEKLKKLETKNIYRESNLISQEVVKKFSKDLPNTLIPYVRLYILRNVFNEYRKGKLDIDVKRQTEVLFEKLHQRLSKFGILDQENSINYQATTIGLEMQPDVKGTTVLKTDMKDINRIISYAGFEYSPDSPFEFVLPPTRTPDAQLLILQEVLLATGVPVDRAGIQINFGGIENRKTIKAIQRIILSAGRFDPRWNAIKERGDYWSLPLQESFKGEVNVRGKGDEEIKRIIPDDENEYGFTSVGEARAPVAADTFFIFARGLFQARKIADHAKAYEQVQKGNEVLGVEIEMAKKFGSLIRKYNIILKNCGLPEIDGNWKKKDWKKFGLIMTQKERPEPYKKVLTDFCKA